MSSREKLHQAFEDFHEEHPGVPLREAARELESNEAELLSSFIGDYVYLLKPEWHKIFNKILLLDKIRVETRTDNGVLEQIVKDSYKNYLHIDFQSIANGFYVEEETHLGNEYSLQFFDDFGNALIKIYFSNQEDFLIDKKLNQDPIIHKKTHLKKNGEFQNKFQTLKDLNEYYNAHKKNASEITKNLHLLGKNLSYPVSINSTHQLLLDFIDENFSIRFSLSNPGTLQTATGLPQEIKRRGPWLHLIHNNFTAKIRYPHVAVGWVTQLPFQKENLFLEVFDKTGASIMGFSCDPQQTDAFENWNRKLREIPKQD